MDFRKYNENGPDSDVLNFCAARSGQVQDDRKFWTVLGQFIRISDRKAKSFPNEEIMKRVDFSIFSS